MRRLRPSAFLLALLLACGVTACSTYSSVKLVRPRALPEGPGRDLLARAFRHDRREPLAAIGEYLAVVQSAQRILGKHPGDEAARQEYGFALGRVIQTLSEAKLDPWSAPLRVPAPDGGEFFLTHRRDPRPEWNPALYEFTTADQFDVGGTYVRERSVRKGIGAPVVAVGRAQRENSRADFGMSRVYYGVTAVATVDDTRRCEIRFEDPLSTETVRFNGRTTPLAADFTVPLAVMLDREDPKKLELARLLRPGKYEETARISRLQPYDPSKTVVLCVHGLMDSPATWAPLINSLRADPEVRRRYQFWFYSYPSGYPYPHSAAILRQQLDAAQQRFPLKRKMVVIGHSMGGMISRLLITDSRDRVWNALFDHPPEQTRLSATTHRMLTDAIVFRHRPEIGRAIFIAAPHRGSDMATNWMGRIGSRLVSSPTALVKAGVELTAHMSLDPTSLGLRRMPNSVDTLSPKNRFVKAIDTIPVTETGIPFHSIIGDRGKGGNADRTSPVRSDGIVPYWSSHLEGAQSELIVPSNHSAHQHPAAIAEVRRILLQAR